MIENEIHLQKNNKVNTAPFTFLTQWKIIFDLFLDDSQSSSYRNILKIGFNDQYSQYDCEYPAIYTVPVQHQPAAGELHICSCSSLTNMLTTCSNHIFPLNQWVSIEVGQEYRNGEIWYYIAKESAIVHEVQNTMPVAPVSGLNAYASNNFHGTASGYKIRNWRYTTIAHPSKQLQLLHHSRVTPHICGVRRWHHN